MRSLMRGTILVCSIAGIAWVISDGRRAFDAFCFAEDDTESAARSTSIQLPEVKDITSMVAEVYCHPFGGHVGPDFSAFEIPKKHFPDVLNYFTHNKSDETVPTRLELCEIGTIRVNLEDGGCVRYCWLEVACKDRLHFSCAGRLYVHTGKWFANDETLSFDGYIRALYQAEHAGQGAEQKPK
jgi:hypothetical protein